MTNLLKGVQKLDWTTHDDYESIDNNYMRVNLHESETTFLNKPSTLS